MLCFQAACTEKNEDHFVFNPAESERNVLQPASLLCNGKKYFLAYKYVGTLLAIADESGRVVHIEETRQLWRRRGYYGFCLDDPVNLVNPLRLMESLKDVPPEEKNNLWRRTRR